MRMLMRLLVSLKQYAHKREIPMNLTNLRWADAKKTQ